MADLLPPSPSVALYSPRQHPLPSVTPMTTDTNQQLSAFKAAAAASSTLGLPRSHSPPPFDIRTTAPDTSSSQNQSYSHSNHASLSFSTSPPAIGPVLRPLDFDILMTSKERTHAELAHTVDDLTQWLSVVEMGLVGMLERVNDDTIEEEQEDSITDKAEDNMVRDTISHDDHLADSGLLRSNRLTNSPALAATSF
jgi:protein-serine/threonine kinase